MRYVDAKDVKSPRESWTLIDVLHDAGEGQHALALGEWDGERRLAMRWNGTKERPAGNPQSRGIPTWFVLPPDYNDELIGTLPEGKQVLAKALLGS
jgi:hypothetical protein